MILAYPEGTVASDQCFRLPADAFDQLIPGRPGAQAQLKGMAPGARQCGMSLRSAITPILLSVEGRDCELRFDILHSAIHVPAVAQGDDHNEQHIVLDGIDDPVLAHSHAVTGPTLEGP